MNSIQETNLALIGLGRLVWSWWVGMQSRASIPSESESVTFSPHFRSISMLWTGAGGSSHSVCVICNSRDFYKQGQTTRDVDAKLLYLQEAANKHFLISFCQSLTLPKTKKYSTCHLLSTFRNCVCGFFFISYDIFFTSDVCIYCQLLLLSK